MLHVRTKIMPSSIEGIGLFADQFIRKGDLVWKFEPGLDITVSSERVGTLPSGARAYVRRYSYRNVVSRQYVLCFDDARYFNHSDTPNTRSILVPGEPESIDVAVRDIRPGEELTTDYTEFDAEHAIKLLGRSSQGIHDLGSH
jgi:SET domain-containing protein